MNVCIVAQFFDSPCDNDYITNLGR